MQSITNEVGGLYFLDEPGGTGKTFLISIILATIRSRNRNALAIASSGTAGTLLDGGRTAHLAPKLPLNWQSTDTPTCNITKNSRMGKVLRICELIIWDECTMAHKKALEALDRSLQNLRGNVVVEHSFYCLVIFDKLFQLYHAQHQLTSLMHVLNHLFYGGM